MSDPKACTRSSLADDGRRRFLYGLSLLVGGATATQLLGHNALATARAYTPNPESTSGSGKVFSQADMLLLRDICAQVIPRTSTAGAADVDTHGFIDDQLHHCYTPQERQQVTSLFIKINQIAVKHHQKNFSGIVPAQQLELLTALETTGDGFDHMDRSRFKFLKGLIVFGYYTSEVGASQELEYLAIPGGFTGSIPYESIGKAWGSMRTYF